MVGSVCSKTRCDEVSGFGAGAQVCPIWHVEAKVLFRV